MSEHNSPHILLQVISQLRAMIKKQCELDFDYFLNHQNTVISVFYRTNLNLEYRQNHLSIYNQHQYCETFKVKKGNFFYISYDTHFNYFYFHIFVIF